MCSGNPPQATRIFPPLPGGPEARWRAKQLALFRDPQLPSRLRDWLETEALPTDLVALSLGLTEGQFRQWCVHLGVPLVARSLGNEPRVWNPDTCRLRPMPSEEWRAQPVGWVTQRVTEATSRHPERLQREASERAPAPNAREQDPDFVLSLRMLVVREQYAFADIGLMFGVTGERVRQWCNRFQIRPADEAHRGMHAVRVWDDETHRFRPIGRGAFREAERAARRAEREANRRQRQAALEDQLRPRMIEQLRDAEARQGAMLSLPEMWEAISGTRISGPAASPRAQRELAKAWGDQKNRGDAIRAMRAGAGFPARRAIVRESGVARPLTSS